MKRFLIATVALAGVLSAASAASAATTASGDVTITGSVAASCAVTSPASNTITLGELAQTDGVTPTFANNSGGLSKTLGFRCNSAAPTITVSATPLKATTVGASPPTGYTDTVNYTATATPALVSGTPVAAACTTAAATCTSSAATQPARLSNSSGNVTVTISSPTANGSILAADPTYQGVVTVTVGVGV